MILFSLSLFLSLLLSPCLGMNVESLSYSIHAQWTSLDYLWDEVHTREDYLASGQFVVQNNALAGIKVDAQGNVYLTVPRWMTGVPATLNKLVQNSTGEFVLSPWPSWDMQEVGVDGDLQNCQSMIIDSQGRMWVIEVGRRNFFDSPPVPVVNGPAGVWLIDVASGNVLSKYYFPDEVVSYNESFVNDIVLDETRQIAYLTDAWGDGALIVYNFVEQTSRRYSGPSTMSDPNYVMIINGVNYGSDLFTTPVDGIAITDDLEALFYCNVQGTDLNRVPTSVLRDYTTTNEEITAAVEVIGTKEPSDGIIYRNGVLYYGSLTESTNYALPVTATSIPTPSVAAAAVVAWPEQVDFRWVDTYAEDLSGSSDFWFVSNNLDLFFSGTMEFSTDGNSNFRVIKAASMDINSDATGSEDDDDDVDTYRSAVIVLSVLFGVLLIGFAYSVFSMKNSKRDGAGDLQQSLI